MVSPYDKVPRQKKEVPSSWPDRREPGNRMVEILG